MSNKKTSKNIVLTIMGVLILAEIGIAVYACICNAAPVYQLVNIVALVGVALYSFWLYKKPHGNMLKYAMLLSAFSIVFSKVLAMHLWGDTIIEGLLPITTACLLCYVAGRLNRINQSKFLLPIILAVLLVCCIIDWVSISVEPEYATIRYLQAPHQFITVLTLCCAYFTRYKEHKEAGLQDA